MIVRKGVRIPNILNDAFKDTKLTLYNTKDPNELLKYYHDRLSPNTKNKKERGEVFTPIKLVEEMLDKLPEDVWSNPNLKWLDPATGIGNFPYCVYMRLMKGLRGKIPNEEKRRKLILEEMLYMVEIDKMNVFVLKQIFCGRKYKLNVFEGSFIENNKYYKDIPIYKTYIKFDIILGNPPFNLPNSIGTGNVIYPLFIKESLKLLINNGYLLFITPPTYRKPLIILKNSPYKDLFKLMTKENQMIYLKIYNSLDGLKIFNVNIRFDIYLIQKKTIYKNTIIIGVDKKEYNINLKEWNFLPNGDFYFVKKLLAKSNNNKCPVLYDRSAYGTDNKKWVSKIKTNEYKYTLIDAINKDGIKYYYSNRNDKGLFGVPKIIFGTSGINNPIIDIKGLYGMTEHAMGIKIYSIKEGNIIKKAITSDKFKYYIKEIFIWSTYLIDWNLFTFFKKSFYKEFI